MKLVAISSLGVDQEYVLRSLHRQFPLQAIIRPTARRNRVRRTLSEKIWKFAKKPVETVSERFNSWYFQLAESRFDRRLAAELRGDEIWNREVPVHYIPRDELHSLATRELLMELAPDVMITSGCPLLRAELFQLPRLGTINVHWGIAPQYRGENTLFWPLYFNDSEHLGVTIHQIDDSIDGGPILAQGWPAVSPFETELSATLKVARLVSELLPRVVKEIDQIGRISGKPPQGTGRLFLARRRRWYHDFLFRCSRSLGGSALSPLPAREVIVHGDQ